MATFKEALQYAEQNPTSDFAKELETGIKSGQFIDVAKSEGVDLTPFVVQQPQQDKQGTTGLGGVAVGVAKGAGSTLTGLEKLGGKLLSPVEKGADYLAEKITGKQSAGSILRTPEQIDATMQNLKPVGTAEKIGFGTEQLGEFFIPGSKTAQVEKLIATKGTGALPELTKLLSKIPKIGENAPKVAEKLVNIGAKAIAQGGEAATVIAAQTGGDAGAVKTAALTGALFPVIGGVIGKTNILGGAANKLEEISLRLTPKEKATLQKQGKDIVEFISNNKITGTPEVRFGKIDSIYDDMEKKVTSVIDDSKFTTKKNKLIEEIKTLPSLYENEPLLMGEVQSLVNRYGNLLSKTSKEDIAGGAINKFKRELYKDSFSKTSGEVTNQAKAELADFFKTKLDSAIPGLDKLNNEYSKIIIARKLLGKAVGRPQVGKLTGIIAGGLAGTAIGGPMAGATGAVIGPAVAEQALGTATKSYLGAGLKNLSSLVDKIPSTNGMISKKAIIELLAKANQD